METDQASNLCRNRDGYFDREEFLLRSCADCYGHLFPADRTIHPNGTDLVWTTGIVEPIHIPADFQNESIVQIVCNKLQPDECLRWTACCVSSEICCESQLLAPTKPSDITCPATWDGYGCWDNTQAANEVSIECPAFIPFAMPNVRAYKTCTHNGTWYTDPDSGYEWTNYTTCLDVKDFKWSTYISIVCNAVSLCVLVPAIITFCTFRSLRKQHRVRLHVHLFLSFILYCLVNILWDGIIVLDHLTHPDSIMMRNMPACKVLYVLTRYCRSSNFLWMFCEALYLYRLLVHAFNTPRSLILFYGIGWGLPWLPIALYSTLRVNLADDSCWVTYFGLWEWIIFLPNLLTLITNVFFLGDIMRILLTQIQPHPNEPCNYRRGLKATFVLVPLFGLQLTLLVYRPSYHTPTGRLYEYVSSIVIHSQGFVVAVIMCFCNAEVIRLMKKSYMRRRASNGSRRSSRRDRIHTVHVQFNANRRRERNCVHGASTDTVSGHPILVPMIQSEMNSCIADS